MLRPILFALLLVAGGTLAWFSLKADNAPAQQVAAPVQTVKILVAVQPLQAGTLLKDADFKERDLAPNENLENSFVADANSRDEIRGAMLRRYLDGGQAVQRPDILRPRDRGFLAAVLAPGTRAVSIGVDATTGASGLISPGDLVDVILAQEFTRGETPAGRRVVAETVLSKVRVIAVDQQIAQGAPTSSGLPGSSNTPRIASTVSLEVSPEQAAEVVVAGRLGRLTLLVRSIDGNQTADASSATQQNNAGKTTEKPTAPSAVFGSDVSAALSQEDPAVSRPVRLIQGDTVNNVVFK